MLCSVYNEIFHISLSLVWTDWLWSPGPDSTAMDWSEQGQYPLAASSLQTISPPPSSTLHPHNSRVLCPALLPSCIYCPPPLSSHCLTVLSLIPQPAINGNLTLLRQNSINKVFPAIFLGKFYVARLALVLISGLNCRISAKKSAILYVWSPRHSLWFTVSRFPDVPRFNVEHRTQN